MRRCTRYHNGNDFPVQFPPKRLKSFSLVELGSGGSNFSNEVLFSIKGGMRFFVG